MNKKNNGLIVKANCLIEASYRLTITEQKIIYMIIASIGKEDADFKDYDFSIKDFISELNLKGQSAYAQLKETTRLLRSRTFTLKSDKRTLQTGWIINADYIENEGRILFNIDPKLKPFLLQLNEKFTKIEFRNIIQLKSSYSVRMYELLKQYQNIGNRIFLIDDLRNILAISKEEYPLYANFKQKLLNVTQKELVTKTDISFDFEEIKTGRKVTAIKFRINSKTTQDNPKKIIESKYTNTAELCITTENNASVVDIRSIFVEDITDIDANKILKASKGDVNLIKDKYEIAKKSNRIKNIVAWMIRAIKEDYKHPVEKVKVDSFNDFEQRTYDFEDLEKKLLGWDNE